MGRSRVGQGQRDVPGASSAATGAVLCLRPSCSLDADHAWELADAVVGRVFECGRPPVTVVLDLDAMSETDGAGCAALLALHRGLQIGGVRLRLATVRPYALEQLRRGGIVRTIGTDAIHPNVRAAVLAAYASRPGPALVTGAVRAVLAEPPEPVLPPPARVSAPPAAAPVSPPVPTPAPDPAENGGPRHPSRVKHRVSART